jgi:hypothetical protein
MRVAGRAHSAKSRRGSRPADTPENLLETRPD